MMEGKIKINDLAISQRQYNIDQDNINDNDIIDNNAEDYDQISCCTKIFRTIFFILFGNAFFIPKGFNSTKNWYFREHCAWQRERKKRGSFCRAGTFSGAFCALI